MSTFTTRIASTFTAARCALLLFGAAVLVTTLLAAGCAVEESAAAAAVSAEAAQQAKVERGRYLVMVGGCNDCHTPWHIGPNGPEPDLSRTLSGHPQDLVITAAPAPGDGPWSWQSVPTNTAFAGPWGVSFTANLTPDEATGTGVWTEDIFIKTLRTGRHWGQSRPILPPMPWFNYGKMSDEDLSAVFAYLRTLPPIRNQVPTPLPPPEAVVAAAP